MKNYFRGNTRSRRSKITKLHQKFLRHQNRWMMRKMLKHFGKKG